MHGCPSPLVLETAIHEICVPEKENNLSIMQQLRELQIACKKFHDFYIDEMATYSIDIISHWHNKHEN